MAETITTAKELARMYMDADPFIPCFVEGPPGVGKSEMWKQLANEKGIGFIDLRLAQMDPVDLRGLPKHEGSLTTWSRPDFWPDEKRDGKKGIILFDELADSSRAMQSAAYQIILDGRAGPHVIPSGWYRAAAGNRREDRAAAQAISTALATRFAWIEVEADVECFLDHAARQSFHHYVMGYLRARPGHVFTMEGANSKTFACPRQWERVSRICYMEPPMEMLYKLVRGLVGEGVAGEFHAAIKTFNLPDLEDILKNPSKCMIPSAPAEKYALSAMLARYAERSNIKAIMTYIKREQFGRDFEICCVLDATKRDATLCETGAFTDFANRNKDIQL